MSKYEPLSRRLRGLANRVWRASFADIEAILGFSLPRSAREYSAWWSNNTQNSRHALAWLNEGWRTEELDLDAERVVFRRTEAAHAVLRRPTPPCPELPTAPASPPNLLEIRLGMTWRVLGRVIIDKGKPAFPVVGSGPAVYRFLLTEANTQQQYVGETSNLARRFGHYRNPGPTQWTNLRINEVFRNALAARGSIDIFAVTESAWIELNGDRHPADFSSRIVRRLFENAAIVDLGGAVKILNMMGK